MRVSTQWLRKLNGVTASAEAIAERLTFAGIEVEGIRHDGQGLEQVVVAEIRGSKPHPNSKALQLLSVWDGKQARDIVCGAPNHAPGLLIPLALPGAVLPNGMAIQSRAISEVVSHGMACSEVELDLGTDASGLLELEESHRGSLGQPLAQALQLNDAVLELSLTPNRSDCLGHLGVAREVAALFEQPFEAPKASVALDWTNSSGDFSIELRDTKSCPRYTAAAFESVVVKRSPFWLRHLLHRLGERSINNVVDVTNLILLETGHPVHAFDLEKIAGRTVVVRHAQKGETLRTLDGVERTLSPDDLLICDQKNPIALAGVMGGHDSAVSDTTREILLECASFDPQTVRRTARRLGLPTQASYRFERGVDPNNADIVIQSAVSRFKELASATLKGDVVDVYPTENQPVSIPLRAKRIERLLGLPVPNTAVEGMLARLGCTAQPQPDGWQVACPTWRFDLQREIDLIEEVGRIHGYAHIPSTLPSVMPSEGPGESRIEGLKRSLRNAAATLGFCEAINYAFCSAGLLERARVSSQAVALLNPLSEEQAVMRTSLLPGLLMNIQHAQRHQIDKVALFELARVYHPKTNGELPIERTRLDLVLNGMRRSWINEESPVDFFDGKGAVETLLQSVLALPAAVVAEPTLAQEAPFLHPTQNAKITVCNVDVGTLGMLHPDVRDAFELQNDVVHASFDVEGLSLIQERYGLKQAQPLPRFPAAIRDIALQVREETTLAEVIQTLCQVDPERVQEVRLFDIYRQAPVPAGHKSLALRILYRDPAGTLSEQDVNHLHAQLGQAASSTLGAVIR